MRQLKKILLISLAAFLIPVFISGCQQDEESAVYRIGAVVAQSGNYAGMGLQSTEGMQLIIDDVNESGGINGVPIELIPYDDKSETTEAALAAKKLIDVNQAHVLVAGTASNLSCSLIPLAEEEEVPSVLLMGTALFNDQLGKWNFNPMGSEETYIVLVLDYMQKEGITEYAALIENGSYGQGAKLFLPQLNPMYGTSIVEEQYFDAGASDLSPQLNNIKNSPAQAIFVWGSSPTAAMAIKQAREIGIDLPMMATPPQVIPSMIESFGTFYEMEPSLVAVTQKIDIWPQLPDDDPDKEKYRAFDQMCRDKYGHPPAMWTVLGAQEIMFAVDGLKRANADPNNVEEARCRIRDAFENTTELELLTGIYTMTPTDHFGQVEERMVLITFEGGEKIYLPQ